MHTVDTFPDFPSEITPEAGDFSSIFPPFAPSEVTRKITVNIPTLEGEGLEITVAATFQPNNSSDVGIAVNRAPTSPEEWHAVVEIIKNFS